MEWLTTALSVLFGGGLTIVSTWLADTRLERRDLVRRKEERVEKLAMRRNDFQRETLLALQNMSQKLLRTTGAMLHQDFMVLKKTGTWQKALFSEGLSDDHLMYNTEIILLSTRILDDEVRDLSDQLRSYAARVVSAEGEQDAQSCMNAAVDIQGKLLQRTGKLIRELDLL